MKKKIIIIVLILLLLGAGGYTAYRYLNNNKVDNDTNANNNKSETSNENTSVDEVNSTYKYSVNGDDTYLFKFDGERSNFKKFTLYKGNEEIRSYTCEYSQCFFKPIKDSGSSLDEYGIGNKVLIAACDGVTCDNAGLAYGYPLGFTSQDHDTPYGTVILYDILTGNTDIFNNVKEGIYVRPAEYNAFGINVLEYNDKTYQLVSNDGKINRKVDVELQLSCYEGCHVLSNEVNDLLPVKKDDKYGLQKLSTGEILLSYEYDDIDVYVSSCKSVKTDTFGAYCDSYEYLPYFYAKKDGVFNIYNAKTMGRVTNEGYDKIWTLSDKIILVYKDKYLSFKYLDETDVIEDKIFVNNILPGYPKNPTGIMISYNSNSTVKLRICDGTSFEDQQWLEYEFNLDTKELKEIK
jgi:hypothetical protein